MLVRVLSLVSVRVLGKRRFDVLVQGWVRANRWFDVLVQGCVRANRRFRGSVPRCVLASRWSGVLVRGFIPDCCVLASDRG